MLLDTHLLLWLAGMQGKLPPAVRDIALDPETELTFSVASLWEIAIKHSQNRADFEVDAVALRQQSVARGYVELPISGEHAVAVATLPWIHKDPFDRLLVAQAMVEGIDLLTVDATLARYPGPIRLF